MGALVINVMKGACVAHTMHRSIYKHQTQSPFLSSDRKCRYVVEQVLYTTGTEVGVTKCSGPSYFLQNHSHLTYTMSTTERLAWVLKT